MTEGPSSSRGEAAWKASRDAIAKRNAETRKHGQAERKSRDLVVETRARAQAALEAKELDALNAALDKRRDATARGLDDRG